jgi:hypothetical protein
MHHAQLTPHLAANVIVRVCVQREIHDILGIVVI